MRKCVYLDQVVLFIGIFHLKKMGKSNLFVNLKR